VRSVWIETDVMFFLFTLDVMVVAEMKIEAAVLLEEVFAECSERTAFLASGNEIPRSTYICCTLFSKFHLGHSREEAEWSPLQLTHFFDFFAVSCFMARFSTVNTQSSALASSRAMAVLLAVEAMQSEHFCK